MKKWLTTVLVLCATISFAQTTINVTRPYTNESQNVRIQNMNGSGFIKNYGTMSVPNLSMGSDTIFNYGTMTIDNSNSGVIINMGTLTINSGNVNSPVTIINQSNGIVSFTQNQVYINNYICNSGILNFKNFIFNNQGKLYSCGVYNGNINTNGNNGVLNINDCGICGYVSPLPVELTYFKVENTYNGSELVWETASEINADYFEILKSYDMKKWIFVDRVGAAGNSNQLLKYSYSIPKEREIVYYQLKQVDFNGDTYDKGILSVKPNLDYTISNNRIYLPTPSDIKVSNSYGQLLDACNDCTEMDINFYPKGLYLISVKDKTIKIMK